MRPSCESVGRIASNGENKMALWSKCVAEDFRVCQKARMQKDLPEKGFRTVI